MSTADLALYVSIGTLLCIIGEWTYVVLWTRRFGKAVTSKVFNAVTNLRTGRGKNPTIPQTIDAAIPEAPSPSTDELSLDNIDLDSPIAQDFISKLSARTGVPMAQLRGLAEQYLGGSGAEPSTASGGGLPNTAGIPGRPPVDADGGGLLGNLIGALVGGKISIEDAAVAAAPYVIQEIAKGQQRGGSASGGTTGYW